MSGCGFVDGRGGKLDLRELLVLSSCWPDPNAAEAVVRTLLECMRCTLTRVCRWLVCGWLQREERPGKNP